MIRSFIAAVFVLSWAGPSSAVEIRNIRPCYGPQGATRHDNKYLANDLVFVAYDIEKLVPDKNGKVRYTATLELVDSNNKLLLSKPTDEDLTPALGGARIASEAHVFLGPKDPPGKYTVQITIKDQIGNDTKRFKYQFEIVKEEFGFVGVAAPAVGLAGQQYAAQFGLVNFKLNAGGNPSVDVIVRVVDETGKQIGDVVKTTPVPAFKGNILVSHQMLLNRPGNFGLEITAVDNNANNRSVSLSVPFTVIDVPAIIGPK